VVKDETQLIDEALQGNERAFELLVRQHQNRLYNSVVHVVGCREEAKDVVQDAFVQAFVKLDRFQRNSTFYTWLYRIAFNAAINRRRGKRLERSVEQSREQTGGEPPDPGDAPADQLLRQERVDQVQAALAALSEDHRAVLVLREIEGCCYDTIAEILNISVGTVRSRLHRARSQMREQLRRVLQGR
jgi:RNA polymerase sigma-70 factor (ECF subfamily)